MKIGYADSIALIQYDKTNVRLVSDSGIELQADFTVRTSGSYSDTLGNTTVYSQSHVGAPTIRFTPDSAAVASAIDAIQNNTIKRVTLYGVTYSETRVAGNLTPS